MDAKLSKIYYSPKGYWKGLAAVKKLPTAAKVAEDVAKKWLAKQALWQIYLPAPRYIPRLKFHVFSPNAVHQADLLFLPHKQKVEDEWEKTSLFRELLCNIFPLYSLPLPFTMKPVSATLYCGDTKWYIQIDKVVAHICT